MLMEDYYNHHFRNDLNKFIKLNNKKFNLKEGICFHGLYGLECKIIDEICNIVLDSAKIDGLILTNTTISRQSLYSKPIKNSWKIEETGGLSGPPLRGLSNEIINRVYKKTKGKIILIGVGGVSSGKDAFEKISLGCNLVQLYTSLIYQGPSIILNILKELSYLLKKNNLKNVSSLVGTNIKP